MAADSINCTTTTHQLDETLVRQSIDFLLHDTGDKILKSEESLLHMENLETAADNGGFSAVHFSLLCQIVVKKAMPARLLQRFLALLVPAEPVPGQAFEPILLEYCIAPAAPCLCSPGRTTIGFVNKKSPEKLRGVLLRFL
jgi:hypothetical protein